MRSETIPDWLPALDRINRAAYQTSRVLRHFGAAAGWLEPGEERAICYVADAVRGLPILDIGVGGGRTAPLLRELSQDYRGIDYVPAMVALARQRFPDLAFLEMDARCLRFPDRSFGLVAFSYNGIDSIDPDGRKRVLQEAYRVLHPGGYFVFSALNRADAALAGRWPDWNVFRNAGRSPVRWLRAMARLMLGGTNRLRHAPMRRNGGEIAVGQISAHNFALVTLFVSVGEQVQQLHVAGFTVDAIFAPDGTLIAPDATRNCVAPWHHYVARKS